MAFDTLNGANLKEVNIPKGVADLRIQNGSLEEKTDSALKEQQPQIHPPQIQPSQTQQPTKIGTKKVFEDRQATFMERIQSRIKRFREDRGYAKKKWHCPTEELPLKFTGRIIVEGELRNQCPEVYDVAKRAETICKYCGDTWRHYIDGWKGDKEGRRIK